MSDLSSERINRDQLFGRQLGFFDPIEHENARVTFVGLGGIGSFAALATAKLGVPYINLVDPDSVEVHNAPNQMQGLGAVGEHKTHSLASLVAAQMGEAVAQATYTVPLAEYPNEWEGYVVSGLDSMEARKEMWERVKMNPNVNFYIDGRIAGQLILIYCLCPWMPDEAAAYEKTLHSDEDAEPASCTERGLIDVGFTVGALITRHIRMRLNGEDVPAITYMSMKSLSLTTGDWIL